MLRTQSFRIACAALLWAAAGALPASAERRAVDFDNGAADARALVEAARAGAKSGMGPVEGKSAGAPRALDEDSIERKIVVFKKSVDRARRMSLVRNTGGVPTKDLWLVNAVAVVVPKIRMQAFESRLKNLGEVVRIEADFVQNWLNAAPVAAPAARTLPPAALPRPAEEPAPPPAGEEPPKQRTPWGITRVNAAGAWGVTRGGGVKVAVIDTGIDFEHGDLKVAGGHNAIDANASYKDDNGHGTHVAGTIAAQDNGQGVVGVAPEVALYGVKVLSAEGSGTFADVIAGIQWAAEHGMAVANMSLGASQGTEALADAVKAAAEKGTAIIAAAGNSGGSVGFPAAYPETIAIAASNSTDGVAWFSSRGPEVDFIAPGVDVDSTYMGGGYDSLSGTSMATPHVAGLAALAVAAQGIRSVDALREALKQAAAKIPNVPDEQQGIGMIDAGRLVSR